MGPLRKRKFEQFCLAYVAQGNTTNAYLAANPGSKCSFVSARLMGFRWFGRADVTDRIAELQTDVSKIVTDRVGLDALRIIEEMSHIAFADIREVIEWSSEMTETIDQQDEGDRVVITRTLTPKIKVKSSAEISDVAAKAISSVSLSPNGTLTIKMHDKLGALKHLEERLRPAAPVNTVNNLVQFIDKPPDETYEQWIERQRRDGHGARVLAPASGAAIGSDTSEMD